MTTQKRLKFPSRQGFDLRLAGEYPVCAAFGTAGVLSSLYFRSYAELLQPLPSGHIEVKVAAIGLNSKDVSVALGRDSSTSHLPSEYSGTVTKIGAGVTGFSVGDCVYGLGKGALWQLRESPGRLCMQGWRDCQFGGSIDNSHRFCLRRLRVRLYYLDQERSKRACSRWR